MKKWYLPIVVAITGACILIVELVAIRALAPYFGNTLYSVSSVITVVLLALSIGYYVGGRMADKTQSFSLFFWLILVSGVSVFLQLYLSQLLLPLWGHQLPLTVGPLVFSIILFFVPGLILGTLSPFAIALQKTIVQNEGIGSVAGSIYSLSTIGSIIGSLSSGFVLVPLLGIQKTFIVVGTILILLGFFGLLCTNARKKTVITVTLCMVFAIVSLLLMQAETTQAQMLYDREGVYERLQVVDANLNGRPVRYLFQDRSTSSALYTDTDELVFIYSQFLYAYRAFKPDLQSALFLGAGAYTMPKVLLKEEPRVTIDAVEIEPELIDLAQEYFGLEADERLRNHIEDGRRFLQKSDEEYDLIFADVYRSLYAIPSHFLSREFFDLAHSRLSDDGIFMGNVIGTLSRADGDLTFAAIRTFRETFPHGIVVATQTPRSGQIQNILLIGSKRDEPLDVCDPELRTSDVPAIAQLCSKTVDLDRFDEERAFLFTDDHAPVDLLNMRSLRRATHPPEGFEGREALAFIKQQLNLGHRYPGAPTKGDALAFYQAELAQLGYELTLQEFAAPFDESITLTNVIAKLHPEREERFLLASHYDTRPFAENDKNFGPGPEPGPEMDPVPGANDGSSGVAVLLELAKHLPSVDTDIGIDIVLFDAEEGVPGDHTFEHWEPFGSIHFANHITEMYPQRKPFGAVVVDMVCDRDLQFTREGASLRDAPIITNALWNIGKEVNADAFSQTETLGVWDDHTPLNAIGIPSTLLIDYDYPWFHTTKDTLDKCSAESLQTVGDVLMQFVEHV